ncbi:conserved hypothetical protein [Burkholderiales bacterium]|nr:conserved hypothetical protein [Burkholderiales bacterium]
MPMLRVAELRTEINTGDSVVVAVDGVEFSIAAGETFALVGESGCGKSITALSVTRLLPDNARVAAGAIEISGTDVVPLPEKRMRDLRGRRVGIIFQEPATSLNPVLPVGTQIVEVIERHTPLRGAQARARAREWLEQVGIPEAERRIDNYPFQLSGGQKQRVMIAIALAAEPELLIADEPTTALDVTIQAQILELLGRLQAQRRMAMLLITHDLAVVAQTAHRVALMYAGQVVEMASAKDFFARPLHPYAQGLFGALPTAAKRGRTLAAIAGTVPPLDRHFAGCRFVERCPVALETCAGSPPQLRAVAPDRRVRCLLYGQAQGGAAATSVAQVARQIASAAALPDVPAVPATWSARADAAAAGEGPRAAPQSPLLLVVRDFHVHFPIRRGALLGPRRVVKAVDGISFTLQAGRTLALVGESGCGKTTTGKAIVQLLRDSARISGSVLLDGQDLGSLQGAALRAARREIQIIFQDPYASLNPRMRVAEILEEGVLSLRPEISVGERRRKIAELVATVGLHAEAMVRYPHEFSGGQRQRIAIARALAVEPRLIVCDEPTSALDVSVQAQILNLLARLQAERGIAYLFITHNFSVVEFLAQEVAVMNAGRIVEFGTAEEVTERPRDAYTRTLLASVPRLATPIA